MTAIHPVNATVTTVPITYIVRWRQPHLIEWTHHAEFPTMERAMRFAAEIAVAGFSVKADWREDRPTAAPSPASAEIDQLLVKLRDRIEDMVESDGYIAAMFALRTLSERLGRVTR